MIKLITFTLVSLQTVTSFPDTDLTFERVWAASCEVTTFVSRSKRSVLDEVPNIRDTEPFFNYLFPLANVQPQEFHAGGARSNSGPSFSWWFDDMVDLWRRNCEDRLSKTRATRKRSRKRDKRTKRDRRGQNPDMNPDDIITWAGYLGNESSAYYSAYFPPTSEPGAQALDNNRDHQFELKKSDRSNGGDSDNNEDTATDKYDREKYGNPEDEEDEDEVADEGEEDEEIKDNPDETTTSNPGSSAAEELEMETTTEAAAAPATSAAPEQDPYFASYGGDVEYFFPLIAFTIPFDGEIQVLGFHGFKGMFLY